jgi:hypothetical protein
MHEMKLFIRFEEMRMDLMKLKSHLRPWMMNATWSTGRPQDEERFHHALHSAFNDLGLPIHADDFSQAMVELLNELHPNVKPMERNERVSRHVMAAERISAFLLDTKVLRPLPAS